MLLLILSVLFAGFMVLELAVLISKRSIDPRVLFSQAVTPVEVKTNVVVRSSNGFGFVFNKEQFSATVLGDSVTGQISGEELSKNKSLSSVKLNPLPSFVPVTDAAAELEVRVETDAAAFATYKSSLKGRTDISALTANYFTPKPSSIATIKEEIRTTEAIGGSLMTKTTYLIEPKFAGNPTRTIVWTTEVSGKPVALTIRGIVDGSNVPVSMQPIMKSMQFNTDVKVEGLSVFAKSEPEPISQKYVADLVSPAVVKIYHIVCGSLVYNDIKLSDDTCNGTAGSGFIVSSDGYIATNGHVVVYGAKDMLANALLKDPKLLERFLAGTKLNAAQVQEVLTRPELTASVVSRIYDLPDTAIKFNNMRELTVVATGKEPFEITDQTALKASIARFDEKENLRKATVVSYDYSAKDQLTLIADPKKGFSASDVALLKITASDAPYIPINESNITQNQPVTLFGFPSDADNQLTDNTKLDVTVTNGTISAIRDAAGSDAKLYQSDADASHGNSGGPAVDENGKVFGLLTYRFESGQNGDAAKSYIRDIADFQKLVGDNSIRLSAQGQTQSAWQEGLDLYSRQHYSEALQQFEIVQRLYPAHRLVSTYIEMTKQAIRDGKDIQDPPAFLLLIGIGAGLGSLGLAISLMGRHYNKHLIYRFYHPRHPHLQT